MFNDSNNSKEVDWSKAYDRKSVIFMMYYCVCCFLEMIELCGIGIHPDGRFATIKELPGTSQGEPQLLTEALGNFSLCMIRGIGGYMGQEWVADVPINSEVGVYSMEWYIGDFDTRKCCANCPRMDQGHPGFDVGSKHGSIRNVPGCATVLEHFQVFAFMERWK
ncbi:hypothetical protein AKJ16_DCAP08056 [Drosera capensis]